MGAPQFSNNGRSGHRERGSGRYAHVVGWGVEVPQQVMTNFDLEKMVDTTDEWIRERTGIAERRIADERDDIVSLGLKAARKALNRADILPGDIDLIIVATSSPNRLFPAAACLIQDSLGATRAGAFDLLAACTGFIYGLDVASAHIKAGAADTVLVIGTETLSRILDWTDRRTCILFGDGAGAFVLKVKDIPGGIKNVVLHSDGSGADVLYANSSVKTHWNGHAPDQELRMNGRDVYRFASRVMVSATEEVVDLAGITLDGIDVVVPHQANLRIIQSAARGLKMDMDKFIVNIDKYGNTSTASIPLALCEAVESGQIKPNDTVLLVAFGGGLTWGAALLEWQVEPTAGSQLREAMREGLYALAQVRSIIRRLWRALEALLFRPRYKRHKATVTNAPAAIPAPVEVEDDPSPPEVHEEHEEEEERILTN
jgi:3-oxoacyl-[acyl-carrier-protein] synthase III